MIPHPFYNIKILENSSMVDPVFKQTFIPKSKKKRIQKKAKKLYTKFIGYKPWEKVFFMEGNMIVCHPSIAVRLREEIRKEDFNWDKMWGMDVKWR